MSETKTLKSLKGTQTEANLLKAFAGESQARNRYTYFASIAKKEGYEQISSIFLETAENEKEHAKLFFKYLQGGDVEITATYPAGILNSTKENLIHSADGEKLEWASIYSDFSKVAKKEGFEEISQTFYNVAGVEKFHEERYRKLIENLEGSKVFKKDTVIKWHCRNCGHVYEGNAALDQCPVCKHPRAYFEVYSENY